MTRSLLSARLLATALTAALPAAVAPARAANLKATVSQAFQAMLFLPLHLALNDGLFAKAGLSTSPRRPRAPPAWRSRP